LKLKNGTQEKSKHAAFWAAEEYYLEMKGLANAQEGTSFNTNQVIQITIRFLPFPFQNIQKIW